MISSEEMRTWGKKTFPDVDLENETEKFIDHARANHRKQADWIASWRNWIRKAEDFRGTHPERTKNNGSRKPHELKTPEGVAQAYQAEFGKPPPVGKSTEEVRRLIINQRGNKITSTRRESQPTATGEAQ